MDIFSFPQIDSSVNVVFAFEGDEYEVAQFRIAFNQPVDANKNQPEGEVRGGRIMLTLTQAVKSNIYGWALKNWMKKGGNILFKTGTSGVIFDVQFANASCIDLKRTVRAGEGLNTTLIISPETVVVNGVEFDNNWVK